MSEILQYIITSVISVIATGGLGSIFFVRQSRKLKDLEVKAAESALKSEEITNLSASNEEWIKLYHESEQKCSEVQTRCDDLVDRLEDVHNSKKDLWEKYTNCQMECAKKDLVINELNWYRCEVNGCPYRKPPRKYGTQDFPKEGIDPIENPDENCL